MGKGMFWVAVALLCACTVPGSELASTGDLLPIQPGKGQLIVKWKGEAAGKSLMGSSWAAAVADAYELVLMSSSGLKGISLSIGSGQAIAVDPGLYRVVVLAGIKRSSGSTTAELIGSAGSDAVSVVEGARTTLDLLLKPIELTLESSGPAVWKGTVNTSASGNSRNPWVGMSLSGATTNLRPRFKSNDLWGGYREASSTSGTPELWTFEASGNVPALVDHIVVATAGAAVCLLGQDAVWSVPSGATAYSWIWPSRVDLAETHPLVPWTEVVLPCGPPSTGVEVGLRWE